MRLSLKANITPDEAHILDTILHAAGFANRTDYLTALILAPLRMDRPMARPHPQHNRA